MRRTKKIRGWRRYLRGWRREIVRQFFERAPVGTALDPSGTVARSGRRGAVVSTLIHWPVALVAIALLAIGCVDDASTPSALELCGPRPLDPGGAVSFGRDTVTMPRADYIALAQYQAELEAYATCLESALPGSEP